MNAKPEVVKVEVPGKYTYREVHVGRYRIWHDPCHPARPYRWAMRDKPDDGVGVQSHGGSATFEGALNAVSAHDRAYRAIEACAV